MGKQIRRYRDQNGLTARELADRCEELGHRVEYQVIANMETGRRSNVPVAEVFVLAAALGVPPAMLVMAIGDDEDVDVLPGRPSDAWNAYLWFTGLGADQLLSGDAPAQLHEVALLLNLYRRHDDALLKYATFTGMDDERLAEAALRSLVTVRAEIRGYKWRPPNLPSDLRPAIAAAEKAAAQVGGIVNHGGTITGVTAEISEALRAHGIQSAVGDSITIVRQVHDYVPAVDTARPSRATYVPG